MKETNVKYVAKKAIGCTDTVKAARELLEEWARSDHALWQSLTEKYISRACAEAIKSVTPKPRKVAWKGEQPSTSERLKSSAEIISIYDMKLPSGKVLGDASRDDVLKATRAYEKLKIESNWKALFLGVVAGRMLKCGRGKIVRNAITESELKKIKNKFVI